MNIPSDRPRHSDGPSFQIDARLSSLMDYVEAPSDDLFAKASTFQGFLQDLSGRGFKKYLLPIRRYASGRVVVSDQASEADVLMFCSADYLDMSQRQEVQAAARAAIAEFGTSVSGVPLLAGATEIHKSLETELATLVGAASCAVFQTGHAANTSAIAALCGARDFIVADKQVHASILEGIKLSRARWCTFRHSDAVHLGHILEGLRERGHRRGILVVLEGVYGLDGDVANLTDIYAVARKYNARVLLDDAHGVGVLGATGAGTGQHLDAGLPDLLMGSLSKSFGSVGGWIAGPTPVIDYLRFFASTLVFSVGLAPASAAAALAAVRLLRNDPSLLTALKRNAEHLKDVMLSLGVKNAALARSPILSARIDHEPVLRDIHKDLFHRGLWGEALAFPAVVRGEERLRLRARASHTEGDIEQAAGILEHSLREHGIIGRLVSVVIPTCEEREPALEALAIESARAHASAPPWFTSGFFGKVISREGGWAEAIADSRIILSGDTGNRAGLLAQIVRVNLEGSEQRVGAIGHFQCLDGGRSLGPCVREAIEWLGTRVTKVFAPFQAPLQMLGGGVERGRAGERPFLEPFMPSDVEQVLEDHGFTVHRTNTYALSGLPKRVAALADPVGVRLRRMRVERSERELAAMSEVHNRSIATLPLCTTLSASAFVQIGQEFRDLIASDLWWIAEDGERVVGFAGNFPDLLQAFGSVGGTGGVSDIDYVRKAVDEAKRGFVAWCGVLPEYSGRGIGVALVCRVVEAMVARGFREAWMSWELTDGRIGQAEMSTSLSLAPIGFSQRDILVRDGMR